MIQFNLVHLVKKLDDIVNICNNTLSSLNCKNNKDILSVSQKNRDVEKVGEHLSDLKSICKNYSTKVKRYYNEEHIKKCSRCNRNLSVTQFYRNSKSADGLQSYCKDCNRKRQKKTNAYLCKQCNKHKPKAEFYISTKTANGLFPICKSCLDLSEPPDNYELNDREHYEKYWSADIIN